MLAQRWPFLAGCALALLIAAGPAAAHTSPAPPRFKVMVLDRLPRAEFARLARRGAVGLLVPGPGPTTSHALALNELIRGQEVNARIGHDPGGPVVIGAAHASGAPSGGNIIVVTLPRPGDALANDRRYRIAVVGGGFHGLLTSDTTRIPGLVSIVDVAPTALAHTLGTLGSTPSRDAVGALARLDARIHADNRLKFPALFIVAGALLFLAAVRPRAAGLAVPAALGTNLALGAAGVAGEVAICTVLTVGTVGGALLLERWCRDERVVLLLCAGVVLLYALAMVAHPDWVAVTPLGPTQNQRFWGIGNQLETLLLAPMLAACVLAQRLFGAVGFAAAALCFLAVMTDNALGADGGGAIALGVALAFLAARRFALSASGFVSVLAAAGGAVVVLVQRGLDAGGPDHLRSAFSGGLGGVVSVLVNRVPLAYGPAIAQWQLVLPLAAVLVLVLVVLVARARTTIQRDVAHALVVATAVSLVVNDSAAYVLTGAIAALCMAARLHVVPAERFAWRFAAARPGRLDES
ncbi:MAG TPA: hypothetical protein VFL60_07100 [Gaiellaceae bacterium]|nr:hypothetical protein [Gaiellaceae bacterium]